MERAENPKLQTGLEGLFRRHRFGINPGLEVERALLGALGNPQDAHGNIHVTGTNGKGSVCALLESMLRAAGCRVGLYTSPHLVRFNERIAVDGLPIADADLAELVALVEPTAEKVAKALNQEPTFFEYATAMGFEHFRRARVQLAVVEVGMGGRLDATNVVTPLVSVITRITLEHTAYLGKDVQSIAREKGGIIKPGRPVVCGAMDDEPLETLRAIARERGSPFHEAGKLVSVALKAEGLDGQRVVVETENHGYGEIQLPLLGRHQLENLATAVAAIEVLEESCGIEIENRAVKAGVAKTVWPARFEVIGMDPVTILDGAHNPGAAETLVAALKRLLKKAPLGLIVGMCNDKDQAQFLQAFGGLVRRAWVVPLATERSTPVEAIAKTARGLGWDVRESRLVEAMKEAVEWARGCGGAVCIAGSLYLAGEVLEMVRKQKG